MLYFYTFLNEHIILLAFIRCLHSIEYQLFLIWENQIHILRSVFHVL